LFGLYIDFLTIVHVPGIRAPDCVPTQYPPPPLCFYFSLCSPNPLLSPDRPNKLATSVLKPIGELSQTTCFLCARDLHSFSPTSPPLRMTSFFHREIPPQPESFFRFCLVYIPPRANPPLRTPLNPNPKKPVACPSNDINADGPRSQASDA